MNYYITLYIIVYVYTPPQNDPMSQKNGGHFTRKLANFLAFLAAIWAKVDRILTGVYRLGLGRPTRKPFHVR